MIEVDFKIENDDDMGFSAEIGGGGVSEHNKLKNRDLPNQHPISAITGLETALNEKQPVITDLEEIRQGAEKGKTAVQPEDITVKDVQAYGTSIVKDGVANIPLANTNNLPGLVRTSSDQGITMNGPYLKLVQATPTQIEDKTSDRLAITPNNLDYAVKRGVTSNKNALTDTEKANACKWLGALPSATKYVSSLSLTINEQTYVLTAQLKDQNGENLGTAQTIDLPLETMVVGAEYDEDTKELVLTLKNGQTVRFSIADLVSGLQPTLTEGVGIKLENNEITNTGLISATYDAENENLVLVGG